MIRRHALAGLLLLSCGGQAPPARPEAAERPAAPASSVGAAPAPTPPSVAAPPESASQPEAPVAAPACPPAGAPPDIPAPEPRTARPGDGVWARLGDAASGDRAGQGESLLYRTVLHPHPASRFITVTLAAVDLCRVEVGYVPGKEDVPKVSLPGPRGLVPEAEQATLIAVFNGGWKPEHGRWGMFKSGVSLVPPRDTGCTISIDDQGRIDMTSGPPASTEGLAAYRQTPPCLFDAKQLHPRLAAGDDKPWGGNAKDVVTRRRSALGIDAERRWLFYAVGEEASPRVLANAMLLAGARTGAELDINWYWTRFLLFGEKTGRLAVSATLIPGMEFLSTGYVERPSDRDFFYLRRRPSP